MATRFTFYGWVLAGRVVQQVCASSRVHVYVCVLRCVCVRVAMLCESSKYQKMSGLLGLVLEWKLRRKRDTGTWSQRRIGCGRGRAE